MKAPIELCITKSGTAVIIPGLGSFLKPVPWMKPRTEITMEL